MKRKEAQYKVYFPAEMVNWLIFMLAEKKIFLSTYYFVEFDSMSKLST